MKTSARRPGHRRIRIVRNLRVLVAAPARSPRCQADAHRVAARLTDLSRVTPLQPMTQPVLTVPPGAADLALGADADVLYVCAHSYPGPKPEGFLDTDLTTLSSPLTAKALILDTCWGAAAALRPDHLPPLALLASPHSVPFDHHVLAGPLLEALLTGPRTGPWPQRLTAAKTTALATNELAAHTRRDWARWRIYAIPGTRSTP
ncbi:hypothetical protein ABZ767_31170 [Streptomyces pseudogriseolus]|uniref:hypothetical protein n=1 Tax=Streptomyces pseudogriseolus TaxID=36817 RepID=UPI00346E28A4